MMLHIPTWPVRPPPRRLGATRLLAEALVLLAALVAWPASAQDDVPLYERDPYDELHLKNKDGSIEIVQVLPLDLPDRQVPANPRPSSKLTVFLLKEPGQKYEVQWKEIAQVKFFEQLVLDEANRLVDEKEFDRAFDYFDWLTHNLASWPGVQESSQRYLFEEARHVFREGRPDYALALLGELARRNPAYDGLREALGGVTEKLIEAQAERDDPVAVRRLLQGLAKQFPDHAVVVDWSARLSGQADTLVADAERHIAAGDLRAAFVAVSRAVLIWPEHAAAGALLADLQVRYPRIVVGVEEPLADVPRPTMLDAAARRAAALTDRPLMEFSGVGPEGGLYASSLGELTLDELDLRLTFRVRPDARWPDGTSVTGHDVARTLTQLADPAAASYRADWAAIFRRVQVRDVFEVDVELARGHPRPAALCQTRLLAWRAAAAGDGAGAALRLGPYRMAERSGREAICVASAGFRPAAPGQMAEVVERGYDDSRAAVAALRRGEVSVLDRVPPWQLASLESDADIVVGAYAVPSLHCLLANPTKPFTAHRGFRRALAYGIPRDSILAGQILQQAGPAAGVVLDGPFPVPTGSDDPLGYAADPRIEPRPYDPRLTLTLIALAANEIAGDRPEGAPIPGPPPLVLVHPANDVARVGCRAIQKSLELLKLKVTLVELAADQALPDYDLLYAELAVTEPLVDARALLASDGLCGAASPYLELALRRLDEANTWRNVRARLREVHRVAYEDTAIIPLWQLTEHFAYRRGLAGLGNRPVTLYQHVEDWRFASPEVAVAP
jgi:ABC-type transport system substrate-binding protein